VVRSLLGYLPPNNLEAPPVLRFPEEIVDDPEMDAIMPEDPRRGYDVRDVIVRLVDGGDYLELQRTFAPNVITAFARMGGMAVGLVANQPLHLAGALDIDASDKASRFIRTCNIFNVPIVTLVDVPGFLPGVAQEDGGIIRERLGFLLSVRSLRPQKSTGTSRSESHVRQTDRRRRPRAHRLWGRPLFDGRADADTAGHPAGGPVHRGPSTR